MDKTTKALLGAIAVGVWLTVALQFLTLMAANDISSDVSFIHQWVLRGAPSSN